jgi:hypothetical protein
MTNSKEPTEIVKMVIGATLTIITASIIGLFVAVFESKAENSTQNIRLNHLEAGAEAIKDNTKALNDLRVAIERRGHE